MKTFLLHIIFIIFFITSGSFALDYKIGSKVTGSFEATKKLKIDLPPGEWDVIERKSWAFYGLRAFSYTLARVEKGKVVEAIGLTKGTIANITVNKERILFENIDTISLYLSPENQEKMYDYVVNLKPNRVIFNPGTENKEFENILEQNGIKTEVACTLVLLSTNQY